MSLKRTEYFTALGHFPQGSRKKDQLTQQDLKRVLDADFYDQIESSIKMRGFGVFISYNRLTVRSWSKTRIFRPLIESGHDVYIYASEDEDFPAYRRHSLSCEWDIRGGIISQ